MRIKTISKILFLIISFIFCFELSNSNAQTAITTVNGTLKSETFTLEWTIGEPLTVSLLDADVFVTQGFHQPEMKCYNCENDSDHVQQLFTHQVTNDQSSRIEIYPNPADQFTNLSLDLNANKQAFIEVYDSYGQRVVFQQLDNFKNTQVKTKLELDHLNSGQYFLRVYNGSFSDVKQFQIIH